MVQGFVCKTSRLKWQNIGHIHLYQKMLHIQWHGGTATSNPGKDNCKERLESAIYWKGIGISEFCKRPFTVCDGIFYRGRRGAYAIIPRGYSQHISSIYIGGEGNPHQAIRINTYRLKGIHYDDKDIWKLTLHAVVLFLTTLQESLCNYQGAKRILAELKSSASEQHQYQHPVDFSPKIT